MRIARRDKVIAGVVLAACAAALARHAVERRPADPCTANPAAYACAMFAQPEWLKRRVYAGRLDERPAVAAAPAAHAAPVEAVSVSADFAPEPAEAPPEQSADGV